jgi:hypothetical protein
MHFTSRLAKGRAAAGNLTAGRCFPARLVKDQGQDLAGVWTVQFHLRFALVRCFKVRFAL